jgi:hypothetical protein
MEDENHTKNGLTEYLTLEVGKRSWKTWVDVVGDGL